jgi:hypothetical protein
MLDTGVRVIVAAKDQLGLLNPECARNVSDLSVCLILIETSIAVVW